MGKPLSPQGCAADYDRLGPGWGKAWDIMREKCGDPYKPGSAQFPKPLPPSLEVFGHALSIAQKKQSHTLALESFAHRVVGKWKTNGAV